MKFTNKPQHMLDKEQPKRKANVKPYGDTWRIEDIQKNAVKEEAMGEHASVYTNTDGSKTMVICNAPLHFKSKDGVYCKFDNTLALDEGETPVYHNKAGDFSAQFAKIPKNELFSINQGDYSLSFQPENSAVCAAMPSKTKLNQLCYPAILQGADLEYSVESNGVKENIVLHEKQDEYRFRFIA